MSDRHALEAEIQQWVSANWDLAITVREWWSRLVDSGLAYPSWPSGVGGRAASVGTALVVRNVLARNEVVAPPVGHVAATLAAPTLFDHGSSDQVNALVRPIALGETAWCQLFSEPGAGSDLASVSTGAVRDGDEWVVTGQKVWNSGADTADLGMLLARTDPKRPQHEGMTYFVIDMDQDGVDVRPLRQMNGQSSFCEVFLTEARIPANRVIGQVNSGWKVARTTLRHERNSVAGGGLPGLIPARSGTHGDLDRAVGDVIDRARRSATKHRNAIRGGAVPTKRMIDLAHEYGRDVDPGIRQELARYASQVRVNGWTMRRIAAAGGRLTGADGSLAKLSTSRICQDSRDLSYRIVGAQGMLSGPESPLGGDLQTVGLGSPGTRIGGGTDEIQLNLLGEQGLGLPREPGSEGNFLARDQSAANAKALMTPILKQRAVPQSLTSRLRPNADRGGNNDE